MHVFVSIITLLEMVVTNVHKTQPTHKINKITKISARYAAVIRRPKQYMPSSRGSALVDVAKKLDSLGHNWKYERSGPSDAGKVLNYCRRVWIHTPSGRRFQTIEAARSSGLS